MADISSVASIPSGTALTEDQIIGIINVIQVNIYNIVNQNKWNGAPYDTRGTGVGGRQFDGARHLQELRQQLAYWESKLDEIPVELRSQYDDPAL